MHIGFRKSTCVSGQVPMVYCVKAYVAYHHRVSLLDIGLDEGLLFPVMEAVAAVDFVFLLTNCVVFLFIGVRDLWFLQGIAQMSLVSALASCVGSFNVSRFISSDSC